MHLNKTHLKFLKRELNNLLEMSTRRTAPGRAPATPSNLDRVLRIGFARQNANAKFPKKVVPDVGARRDDSGKEMSIKSKFEKQFRLRSMDVLPIEKQLSQLSLGKTPITSRNTLLPAFTRPVSSLPIELKLFSELPMAMIGNATPEAEERALELKNYILNILPNFQEEYSRILNGIQGDTAEFQMLYNKIMHATTLALNSSSYMLYVMGAAKIIKMYEAYLFALGKDLEYAASPANNNNWQLDMNHVRIRWGQIVSEKDMDVKITFERMYNAFSTTFKNQARLLVYYAYINKVILNYWQKWPGFPQSTWTPELTTKVNSIVQEFQQKWQGAQALTDFSQQWESANELDGIP